MSYFANGAPDSQILQLASANAFQSVTCGHCGDRVGAAVLAVTKDAQAPQFKWLRCSGCQKGLVFSEGQIWPSGKAGEPVEGLPTDTAEAYEEARRSAAAASYTSCELMCRKILMHIAVDKGAEPNKTFAFYLDHLVTTGYITPPMRPWVDAIRERGNIATHELPPSSRDRGLGTLAFTAQLLRLVYEMDFKVKQFLPVDDAD